MDYTPITNVRLIRDECGKERLLTKYADYLQITTKRKKVILELVYKPNGPPDPASMLAEMLAYEAARYAELLALFEAPCTDRDPTA